MAVARSGLGPAVHPFTTCLPVAFIHLGVRLLCRCPTLPDRLLRKSPQSVRPNGLGNCEQFVRNSNSRPHRISSRSWELARQSLQPRKHGKKRSQDLPARLFSADHHGCQPILSATQDSFRSRDFIGRSPSCGLHYFSPVFSNPLFPTPATSESTRGFPCATESPAK